MIWRRLKNLWLLSGYRPLNPDKNAVGEILVKDFPTMKKKLAKIIVEKKDNFEDDVTAS